MRGEVELDETFEGLVSKICEYNLDDDEQKLSLINSQIVVKVSKIESIHLNKKGLVIFFDVMLELIQQCSPYYQQIITSLNQASIIKFLQNCYLNY